MKIKLTWTLLKKRIVLFALIVTSVYAVSDCRIHTSDQTVDYGKIVYPSKQDLMNGYLILPKRSVAVSVDCPEPERISLQFNGRGDTDYELGDANTVMVEIISAQYDDNDVSLRLLRHGTAKEYRLKSQILPGDIITPVLSGGTKAEKYHFSLMVQPRVDLSQRSSGAASVNGNIGLSVISERL